jgi:hypothetical protein
MKKGLLIVFLLGFIICINPLSGQKKKDAAKDSLKKETGLSSTFAGLSFRSIGPAWASGRIADFAVNPENHSEIYVGVSAGNVWKTTNNGTTWTPVFDKYGAYSIRCLKMDPSNPSVIWVGTVMEQVETSQLLRRNRWISLRLNFHQYLIGSKGRTRSSES